jgi:hypothetical protein
MKSRIIFYSTVCAVLGASAWLLLSHAHRPPKSFHPEASSRAAPSPARTTAATKPEVASAPASSTSGMSRQQAEWSPAIYPIIDDQADYRQRLAAIKTIAGKKLGDADREALYAFLRQKSGLDNVQMEQVVKNRLMDVLCALNPPPTGLLDLLAQICHDPDQNGVLRDYAVQHVTAFYQQLEIATEVAPQDKSAGLAAARKILWDALAETGTSIAGTALLGLTRLSRESPEAFDPRQIGGVAEQMAGAATSGELTRITAIQVCAQLKVQDALPLIQAAVQNGQTMTVRISAIGALGSLGGAEQIPLLNHVLQGTEERLKLPAQHALNQIENRLQTQAKSS